MKRSIPGRWWKDRSIATKLYALFGLLAVLVAVELLALLFAMNVLSSIRAFVEGEGLWSKAQKNALQSLYQYALTGDESFYDAFTLHLRVPYGDRRARQELESPTPDMRIVREGFQQGGIHPDDIDGVVNLMRTFGWLPAVREAMATWRLGDERIDALANEAQTLHRLMGETGRNEAAIAEVLKRVERLNSELTELEIRFSSVLGAGSRQLERALFVLLLVAVMSVSSLVLLLTFRFSRNLSMCMRELADHVAGVGRGDFSSEAPVRSKDELGQLSIAINRMTASLKTSIGRRKAAESASQTKSMFLANMSHEIRTPLGVILGMIEILKDPALSSEEREHYLQIIERTGQNLTGIINDILDLSKVEAGHLMIEKSAFALSELIGELRTPLEFSAERSGNRLTIEAEGEVPAAVISDRLRLRQIIVNLVNNSLKFTEDGEVQLTYGMDRDRLWFRVSDTGIGIPEDRQEELFQVFSQIDSSMTRKREGTGLGLALSKRLAESLGGDLVLERSEVGKGSTFLLSVPAEKPSFALPHPLRQAEQENEFNSDLKDRRVLLVDDSVDNQTLIRVLLSRKGAEVESAMNGLEGVRKARSRPYDLILMDMQMPIMDGYEATRQLRNEGYIRPIVALTAHAMKEDRERCLDAGCNDYVTKPIETNAFYRTLSRHISPDGIGHA